ncbi:MICAL-like protein 2 [Nymphon striatum]|nr:MICAL-like protein 2 [Nymphon striatum]
MEETSNYNLQQLVLINTSLQQTEVLPSRPNYSEARNINRPYKNASRKIQSVLYDKCNNFSKFSHDAKVCIVRIEKELFNLKRQKNFILRRESELLYILQETILQEEYTKLKDEVHFLQTISNNEKAQDDQEREDAMVEQMISIVEQRNNMLLDIDIERLRENEEDAELYEEHEKKEKEWNKFLFRTDEKSQNNFRTEIELNGERPLAALKRQVFMNSSQQGLRKLNKQASEECTIL